jgi:multiple sugar transport system permease protein
VFTDISTHKFVDFDNIKNVINNSAFQNASKNTILFILTSVPMNIILSFLIASALMKMKRHRNLFVFLFLIPFMIPSGTLIYFWKIIFDYNGLANRILYMFGETPIYWLMSKSANYILGIIFLHKNLGFNIFLFLTGLRLIPKDYYDYAAIEGANRWNKFKYVTITNIMPTAFFAIVMCIVHSFSVFREIYILFGNYPHSSIYMLQHYMNNQFLKLNFTNLSSASFLITAFMAVIICTFYFWQRKRTAVD